MKFIIKSKGGDESKSFANQFDAICRARKNELLEEEFSTHTKKLEEINTLEKKKTIGVIICQPIAFLSRYPTKQKFINLIP